MKQLHKRFETEQVKELLNKYEQGNIKREALEEVLGISKAHFFRLLKAYRGNNKKFSIDYKRSVNTNEVKEGVDDLILEELKEQQELIVNPQIPTHRYNYSWASQEIYRKHKVEVCRQTIVNRAKLWGYYRSKTKNKQKHDRFVYTNNIGELIQHDSSHHLFAPFANVKWYLITSIDDYSRLMLEARFIEAESSIEHIKSLERVFTKHGFPLKYYSDNHSIFRFIAGRDEMLLHKNAYIETDGIDTQWLQVLKECGVNQSYALSPQAKGKIERPYQWVQDHIVRRCFSDRIASISDGQQILNEEVKQYNFKRIHSTIGEVPFYRFQRAKREGNNLFRRFVISKPFVSKKDIFSLRFQRRADGYRQVSLKTLNLKVNGLNPYDVVEIRLYKLNLETSELRFWRNDKLLDVQIIKNVLLKGIHF
jgi:hypothetical protein